MEARDCRLRTAVGPVDMVAPGETVQVCPAGMEALAVSNVDGTIHVTADTCTHATASLSEGTLEGYTIVCPVHWGEFDVRTGEALCFPVSESIRVYPARVEDGEIVVTAIDGEQTKETA